MSLPPDIGIFSRPAASVVEGLSMCSDSVVSSRMILK
jgi:hypothetical protein